MSISNLTSEIEKTEDRIKSTFPKQKGRVAIAEAKQNADYALGKPSNSTEEMRWAVEYLSNLKSYLR